MTIGDINARFTEFLKTEEKLFSSDREKNFVREISEIINKENEFMKENQNKGKVF